MTDHHDEVIEMLEHAVLWLEGSYFGPQSDRDAALRDVLIRVIEGRKKAAPEPKCLSNCRTCGYAHMQEFSDGGHCYMFKDEPVGVCSKWLGV